MNKLIKDLCKECESNIIENHKGCAFRSLGNEYCSKAEELNNYISDLQRESKQLKEQNELEFNDFVKFRKEQEDKHLEKTDKLIKENTNLKQALIDIKKICVSNMVAYDDEDDCGVDCCVDGFEVLQIINKLLGEEQ